MTRFLPIFLALSASAIAQTPTTYVRSVGPGQTWTVEIEDRPSEDAEARPSPTASPSPSEKQRPVEAKLVRMTARFGTNGIFEGIMQYSDQRQDKFYIVQDMAGQAAANSDHVVLTMVARNKLDASNFMVPFFSGLGWVAKSNLVGREKRGDVDVLHFYLIQMLGNPPQPADKLEAWIRESDGQPLEVWIGNRVQHYSEPAPFSESITPPERFQKAFAKVAAEKRVIEAVQRINKRSN